MDLPVHSFVSHSSLLAEIFLFKNPVATFENIFQVDLKAFLDLFLPNKYCPMVIEENCEWFLGEFSL